MITLCCCCAESGDALYDGFAADFGRRHASMHEYEHRRAVFHSNRQLIEAHNAAGRNFTLGINRFADWTEVCAVQALACSMGCLQYGLH